MFERKSQILVDAEKATEDQLMGEVLDVGADDIRDQGGAWEILSAPEAHDAVLHALEKARIPTESSEIAMVPKNTVKLEGKNAQAMLKLYEALEEHDDVQNVYGNYEVDEAEVEALA
jgi:transcriptional/translational regulatory protein YebC/TACO1